MKVLALILKKMIMITDINNIPSLRDLLDQVAADPTKAAALAEALPTALPEDYYEIFRVALRNFDQPILSILTKALGFGTFALLTNTVPAVGLRTQLAAMTCDGTNSVITYNIPSLGYVRAVQAYNSILCGGVTGGVIEPPVPTPTPAPTPGPTPAPTPGPTPAPTPGPTPAPIPLD